jgi:hypothetical protein
MTLVAATIIITIIILLEVTAFIFHAQASTIIRLIITCQLTHIVGTDQHPTLVGIGQHTTTITHLITVAGAATTADIMADTTTTTADTAVIGGPAGKLLLSLYQKL